VPLLDDDETSLDAVAHSLGCYLWAHVATAMGHVAARRVLLVAPPGRAEVEREIPTFTPAPLGTDLLLACADTTVLLGEPWQ
jgi:predicted alpha/beta hydrolase family esterase